LKAICCFLLLLCFISGALAAPDRTASLAQEIAAPKPLGVSMQAVRADLKQILSAPEFSETVHGPTPWERWRRQFIEWLARRLEGLFKAIAQHPGTVQIVFWLAAVAALGLTGFLIFQLFRREERILWNTAAAVPLPSGGAREWIRAAQSAQAKGDLNQAIQCLYWASVAQLQESGALPKTPAHTPRELLRAARAGSLASPLQRLTAALERFWYARITAAPEDFARCLEDAAALGCKLA